jgi:hypothetical protein
MALERKSALEQKSQVVDGQKLAVQPIDPFTGFKAWPRVLRILGVALRRMPVATTPEEFMAAVMRDPANVGDLLIDLCEHLSESELDWLMRTHMEGNAWVDNDEFMEAMGAGKVRGGILGIYRALWFAIQVNYSSFLDGLAALAKKAAKASPSETSTT